MGNGGKKLSYFTEIIFVSGEEEASALIFLISE